VISINEQDDAYALVNKALHLKSAELLTALKSKGLQFNSRTTVDIQNEGISPEHIYFVKEGNISIEYDDKTLYIFEAGDVISRPMIEGAGEAELYYTVKSEIEIEAIPTKLVCSAMADDPTLISLWFSITAMCQLQLNQMVGVLTKKEERANPGFGRYKAGMEIIKEGDDADFVYSVSEGTAVAIHNGVEVGEIQQDEIFGAIAVLTDQKRTASVVAKTNCTVLMVHKDEFSKMVSSHPKLFLNILSSLAEKIISLNEKVSQVNN